MNPSATNVETMAILTKDKLYLHKEEFAKQINSEIRVATVLILQVPFKYFDQCDSDLNVISRILESKVI